MFGSHVKPSSFVLASLCFALRCVTLLLLCVGLLCIYYAMLCVAFASRCVAFPAPVCLVGDFYERAAISTNEIQSTFLRTYESYNTYPLCTFFEHVPRANRVAPGTNSKYFAPKNAGVVVPSDALFSTDVKWLILNRYVPVPDSRKSCSSSTYVWEP